MNATRQTITDARDRDRRSTICMIKIQHDVHHTLIRS